MAARPMNRTKLVCEKGIFPNTPDKKSFSNEIVGGWAQCQMKKNPPPLSSLILAD
jgi:hypothetical protein